MPDILMPPALTTRQRAALKAKAHHLEPIVRLGRAGLTDAFVAEVDRALADHELIKVRIDTNDREARTEAAEAICARTASARVGNVGKIFVLWRPKPEVG
ncbi:MAG: ribosome assembly RNA-binding protein YhbY [Acidobacteriota bacterium]